MKNENFDAWFRANTGCSPFISSWEMLIKGSSHSNRRSRSFGLNTDPARALWSNCVPLVKVLNEIRRRSGTGLHMLSVYRSSAYNKSIPGASTGSLHMQFKAADVTSKLTPRKIAEIAREMRREGFFKGGIGTYRTFTHIDVRGRNVDF